MAVRQCVAVTMVQSYLAVGCHPALKGKVRKCPRHFSVGRLPHACAPVAKHDRRVLIGSAVHEASRSGSAKSRPGVGMLRSLDPSQRVAHALFGEEAVKLSAASPMRATLLLHRFPDPPQRRLQPSVLYY